MAKKITFAHFAFFFFRAIREIWKKNSKFNIQNFNSTPDSLGPN